MPRSSIIVPRSGLILPRQRVVPVGLTGRASLAFDGVDDKVTGAPLPAYGTGPLTLVAWVCIRQLPDPDCAAGFLRVGGFNGRHLKLAYLRVESSGAVGAAFCGTALAPFTMNRQSPGLWFRLVGTFEPEGGNCRRRTYVNAVADATDAVAGVDIQADVPRIATTHTTVEFAAAYIADARIYSRAWTPAEVAADFRGEWVDPTGLVRRWTCENPGYGSTCHEEIGGTDDAISGAVWSPNVPLRRRRIVEDVPAAFYPAKTRYITVPHHADLDAGTGPFGWMGWIRDPGTDGVNRRIYVKGYGAANFQVQRSSGGAIIVLCSDGGGSSSVEFPIRGRTGWIHVAANRVTPTVMEIYDNASLRVRATVVARDVTNTDPLGIGGYPTGAAQFEGALGDVVWRKGAPFTWEEIEAHYYDGIVPTPPSGCPQIYWPLREGSGTTAYSYPSGYNGTLSAASWTTDTRCRERSGA